MARESKLEKQEQLKGALLQFLEEFEVSEQTEHDMKSLLSVWADAIMHAASDVGGHAHIQIKMLITVCEDYAHCRGLLERVRQVSEETRLYFGL